MNMSLDDLFDKQKMQKINTHRKDDENNIMELEDQSYQCEMSEILINEKEHKIIVMSDITQVIEAEHERMQLEYQVLTDFLTKLPNRESFNRKLLELMQNNNESEKFPFTLFFIDLDGFKNVNDTFGHSVGDKLLIHIAQVMQDNVRESDFVARLGGDEFVIILKSTHSKENIISIANKLLKTSEKEIVLDDNYINISMSIGILMNPKTSYTLSSITSMADRAM